MAGWRDLLSGQHPLQVLGAPSSGATAAPSTGPNGVNAGQLNPNSRDQNMEAGVPYQLVPAYPPFVRIANNANIIYMCRTRTLIFGGNGTVANTSQTQQFQFSLPTIIIARSGAAIDASDAGLPVGRQGLDLFTVQFFRVGTGSSEFIDAGGGGAANPAVTVLGSTVLGTAANPSFFPGTGLFADTGGFINVTVTTLRANTLAHVTIWCIEEYGPARG